MAKMVDGIESEVIELILQRKYFYGHLLQQFRRHYFDSNSEMGKVVKTLGVNVTNDLQPNLFINTDFYSSGDYDPAKPGKQTWGLTVEEKIAVLEHEILHILSKHLLRMDNRNSYVWNLATDIAINQYIAGLPHGALCPDCNVVIRKVGSTYPSACPRCGTAIDIKVNKFEPLQFDTFRVGAKKINLEKGRPAEVYYDCLWAELPKVVIEIGSKMTNSQEKASKDQLGDGELQEGEGDKQDGAGKEGPADGGYTQKEDYDDGGGSGGKEGKDSKAGHGAGNVEVDGIEIPTPLDAHEAWAAGSDNKEMAHEKIKDMVQKAIHKVTEKSQGYMPGWLKGLVDECIDHKTITWKSELRRFYGYREFSHFISTRKRLNRRFGITQPGYKVKRKAHFLVAVDSSGSVSDDEFAKFWSEIGRMSASGIGITYVECDADITHVMEYKKKPARGKGIKRYGYGGTDFRPVFKFAEQKTYTNAAKEKFRLKDDIDGIIYCTDGFGSFPSSIPCPTIWVLTQNHSTSGWSEKLGKTIVMKD